MNNILYTFLLACSVILGGCYRTRQVPEDLIQEKEPAEMIQIHKLTLTDYTLTLNYRVSNPFEDSIWVCYDTWVHGEQDVHLDLRGRVGEGWSPTQHGSSLARCIHEDRKARVSRSADLCVARPTRCFGIAPGLAP